jgi:hypothetical protein
MTRKEEYKTNGRQKRGEIAHGKHAGGQKGKKAVDGKVGSQKDR